MTIPCPLAAHNAEVEAEQQRAEAYRKFESTLQTVTLPDLEWLQVGFHTMSDDQQIAWLKQQIAKNIYTESLSATQMKGATALLNKLQADKRAVEHTGAGGGPIKADVTVTLVKAP